MNDTLPSPSLLARVRVVMVSTSHPGNIGSAARAMKTMGLSELVLVSPRQADAVEDSQAQALASGATDVLDGARIVSTLADALADVHFALAFTARRRELSHGMKPLREATADAMDFLATSQEETRVALVFGNETFGLSNEEVDRCQMIAMIPANPAYSSLNVSQAIQLAAYEFMMADNAFVPRTEEARRASSVEEVEGFLQHLESAAVQADFLDPQEPKRFMTRMRRLFTRARMEPEEVAILRGVLAALMKRR
ncbi:MAG: RNA methyltransferase [Betaproteobacteria bacterium]|nr:RNA methyltransferase [Betaproteobacteria bacterium]